MFLDYDHVFIRPDVLTGDCSRCGLIPQFKLFNLRQTPHDTQDLGRLLGLGLEGEMDQVNQFHDDHHDLVQQKTVERYDVCTTLERNVRLLLEFPTTTNIMDVLSLTQRD